MSSTKRNIFLLVILIVIFACLQCCVAQSETQVENNEVTLPLPPLLVDNEPVTDSGNNEVGDIPITDGEAKNPDDTTESGPSTTDVGFVHAFVASLSVILVSELGDKTFFIAAIMAMSHPRVTVFAGAIAALAMMTALSAVFGIAATVIPRIYTYYISAALFAIFGLMMLKDGYYMSPKDSQEELEEVQSDIRKREDDRQRQVTANTEQDAETGVENNTVKHSGFYYASRIFMQAFTMTFVAEWGDRSQITTIILAASEDVYGVIVGGVLGHALCTGLAVIGGRMIAQKISVRTVTLIGGVVFLLFAVSALFFDPNES